MSRAVLKAGIFSACAEHQGGGGSGYKTMVCLPCEIGRLDNELHRYRVALRDIAENRFPKNAREGITFSVQTARAALLANGEKDA